MSMYCFFKKPLRCTCDICTGIYQHFWNYAPLKWLKKLLNNSVVKTCYFYWFGVYNLYQRITQSYKFRRSFMKSQSYFEALFIFFNRRFQLRRQSWNFCWKLTVNKRYSVIFSVLFLYYSCILSHIVPSCNSCIIISHN